MAIAARIRKINRQPSAATTRPPTVGAMMGAMPKTIISMDSTRAISLPENRSRTTALLPAMPTQPPSARKNRRATRKCIDGEKAHPREPNIDKEAEDQWFLSPIAIHHRTIRYLSDGDPDEIACERESDVGDIGLQTCGNCRKAGKIHVDRNGPMADMPARTNRMAVCCFRLITGLACAGAVEEVVGCRIISLRVLCGD